MNLVFDSLVSVLLVVVVAYASLLATRVASLERATRALLERGAPSDRVRGLATDASTRIDAMRAYREETGADVRVAKAIVDTLAAGRP